MNLYNISCICTSSFVQRWAMTQIVRLGLKLPLVPVMRIAFVRNPIPRAAEPFLYIVAVRPSRGFHELGPGATSLQGVVSFRSYGEMVCVYLYAPMPGIVLNIRCSGRCTGLFAFVSSRSPRLNCRGGRVKPWLVLEQTGSANIS